MISGHYAFGRVVIPTGVLFGDCTCFCEVGRVGLMGLTGIGEDPKDTVKSQIIGLV